MSRASLTGLTCYKRMMCIWVYIALCTIHGVVMCTESGEIRSVNSCSSPKYIKRVEHEFELTGMMRIQATKVNKIPKSTVIILSKVAVFLQLI